MGLKRHVLRALARTAPAFWESQLKNPLFIIGVARSGTTLLNDLLSQHRDIAGYSEANDIWDPAGYPWAMTQQETAPVWLDPEAFTARWWRDVQPRQQEIRAIFGAYQWLQRKRYFLNKSPFNTLRIAYLLEMFPDARFIHIVRDGRAVVQSYSRKVHQKITSSPNVYQPFDAAMSWEEVSQQLAAFWKFNIEVVDRQIKELQLADRGLILEITYEQLCEELRPTLAEVCAFIGVEMDRFSAAVWQTETRSQNHKWKDAYGPELLKPLNEKMQPMLKQKGYR